MEPAGTATAVVEMLRAGRFDEVVTLFAPRLRAVVSVETLRAGWAGELAKAGPVTAIGRPNGVPTDAGLVRVSIPVTCARGALVVVMSIDAVGAMHGLRLSPATASWQPPPYADPGRFVEHEVTLGSGRRAVPGTLTLTRGRRRAPGVVLLGGGGPTDRDGTSGANKPLKDLAWGLASRGAAVVRFDKISFVRPEVAAEPGFTMTDEYVPHAVAALRLLRQRPGVDPARLFVLGHSMGGRAAPRVVAADASVVGLVILAGDTQPMHHAAVRVARHLASANPDPFSEATVTSFERQATLIDSAELSPATPAADLPFGWPASYWLDLRGDDPVATAATLDRPMLILQGGRDYQVTVEDDLTAWRAGLAHRPDVTIRVYDADNHLFFPGSGPSTPAEYEPPQHVDPTVVADIVEWLAPRGKPGSLLARLRRGPGRGGR